MRWKDRYYTGNSLRGIQRVQCREYQVASLGGSERRLYGLIIAHLAYQDHIRILAQSAAQRFGKAARIDIDFALIYIAFLVSVQKLDRVFNCDDMVGSGRVDVFDYRSQRCR